MTKTLKKVLTVVLIVICVAGLVTVARLSNNFTTDVKTFYVKIDGKMITDRGSFTLNDTFIEVCSVSGKITGNPTDFTVRILRNTSVDSPVFYADGSKKTLADVEDYTRAFTIVRSEKGFTVKSTTLTDVLKKAFNATAIELPEGADKSKMFFTVVVTGGSNSVLLDFGIPVGSDRIVLDQTEITF